MDMLQQLVETLRVLARTNEPNRVALTAVDEYLNDKAGIVRLSLERVCDAIDREEAEKRPIEDWSIAKDYALARAVRRNIWCLTPSALAPAAWRYWPRSVGPLAGCTSASASVNVSAWGS